MGRSIRPRRDPALTIKEVSGLVSNESADTTDEEHFRSDDRLSHRSGRRLTSGLSDQCSRSHMLPLSLSIYLRDKKQQRDDVLSLMRSMYCKYKSAQPFGELGNLPVPLE